MNKSLSFLAAFCIGLLTSASFSVANAQNSSGPQGPCQGELLDEQSLDGFLLVLESNGNADPQAVQSAVRAAAAAPDDVRTVIVDGIVMQMHEMVVQGLIANGTFIVVYAGTTIPITEPQDLPCWVNPDCP